MLYQLNIELCPSDYTLIPKLNIRGFNTVDLI